MLREIEKWVWGVFRLQLNLKLLVQQIKNCNMRSDYHHYKKIYDQLTHWPNPMTQPNQSKIYNWIGRIVKRSWMSVFVLFVGHFAERSSKVSTFTSERGASTLLPAHDVPRNISDVVVIYFTRTKANPSRPLYLSAITADFFDSSNHARPIYDLRRRRIVGWI